MYAVQCGKQGPAPDKATVTHCAGAYTHHVISQLQPKVIVAMGTLAFQSLGLKGTVKDLRGKVMPVTIDGTQYKVIPTISPVSLLKREDAGLYSVIKNDVARAANEAAGLTASLDMGALTASYEIPKSIPELAALAEDYATYTEDGKTIGNTLMALDTETNTLTPWEPGAKVIMVSAAVDKGKACAIFLDHREAPYDWREALPYVLRITMSPHPKTWWNYKFDRQMFWCTILPALLELCQDPDYRAHLETITRHSLEDILEVAGLNNTRWDGLLGEHLLDEDKKGFYGLKTVVADYLPEYAGYDDELSENFKEAGGRQSKSELAAREHPLAQLPIGLSYDNPSVLPAPLDTKFSEYYLALCQVRDDAAEKRADWSRKNYPEVPREEFARRKEYLTSRVKNLDAAIKQEKAEDKAYQRFLKTYMDGYQRALQAKIELGNTPDATYEDIDPDILSVYAAIDADVTKQITRRQRIRAYREDPPGPSVGRPTLITLMRRHYLPLTEALSEIQAEGVCADREYLHSIGDSIDAEKEVVEREIRDMLFADVGLPQDKDIKLNNPSTLGDILNGMYGLPVLKTTDKGQASMAEAVLTEYAEGGYDIAERLLTWRKLGKARSTYIKNLLELSSIDGRIRGNVHINGTATGRTSSSQPNLQNLPHMLGRVNIKKAFIPTPVHRAEWWDSQRNRAMAERYGWRRDDRLVWVDVDFAGAEVRVLCRYAQDPALLEALNRGDDMHSWMTAEIHGLDYEFVNKDRKENPKGEMATLRSATKRVVFGTIYGAGAAKIGEQIGVDETEAQAIIDKLMRRFPLIKRYMDDTRREIAKKLRVVTPYGRFRRFPMANVGRWMKGRNDRQGINFLVQSYCSDIVMSCLVNMHRSRSGISGRLLLTVHDSICLEMPDREISKLLPWLNQTVDQHIKKQFPDMPVSMPYDVDVGYSYGEKQDISKFVSQENVA